jgi:hypothetical protein
MNETLFQQLEPFRPLELFKRFKQLKQIKHYYYEHTHINR